MNILGSCYELIGSQIKSKSISYFVELRSQGYLARVSRPLITVGKRRLGNRDILLTELSGWKQLLERVQLSQGWKDVELEGAVRLYENISG